MGLGLQERRRVYWGLLPVLWIALVGLFWIARVEGTTALPALIGVPAVLLISTLWWIFVPSSWIGRCPRCGGPFFATKQKGAVWPAGNPFRTRCGQCDFATEDGDASS